MSEDKAEWDKAEWIQAVVFWLQTQPDGRKPKAIQANVPLPASLYNSAAIESSSNVARNILSSSPLFINLQKPSRFELASRSLKAPKNEKEVKPTKKLAVVPSKGGNTNLPSHCPPVPRWMKATPQTQIPSILHEYEATYADLLGDDNDGNDNDDGHDVDNHSKVRGSNDFVFGGETNVWTGEIEELTFGERGGSYEVGDNPLLAGATKRRYGDNNLLGYFLGGCAKREKSTSKCSVGTASFAKEHFPEAALLGQQLPLVLHPGGGSAAASLEGEEGEDCLTSRPVFLNVHEPFCLTAVGIQGGGKSHSLACVLESCLLPFPEGDIVRLCNPMTALVLHYDQR